MYKSAVVNVNKWIVLYNGICAICQKRLCRKKCQTVSICRRQNADSRFAKRNDVFWQILYLTANAIKCRITICRNTICQNTICRNVVLTTSCNDQQQNNRRMSEGLRVKRAPSDPRPRGRRCSESANCFFFCVICQFGKSWFGKLSATNYVSANRESANCTLANCTSENCYPPLYDYFI